MKKKMLISTMKTYDIHSSYVDEWLKEMEDKCFDVYFVQYETVDGESYQRYQVFV